MLVDLGVPQGSVLGPVVFSLYTTPLTSVVESHSIRHEIFSDDTQLSHSELPDNNLGFIFSHFHIVRKILAVSGREQTQTK